MRPGDTPPGEASTGGPQGHDEGARKGIQVVAMVTIGIVVLLCLVFFIGYIVGLL